ncbi:hypothetical protein BCR33DRAFT_722248 [Rhizoclosmatium globosum]|uniref:C3H1-type domain-containing protein n=1 Tax=Rhizoclosmatium globosum TaxID=329046 RepID=A0A1Y2BN12_9FUNG|nr:hypothetical protein BCR33DRAFT_722248 [Rhizoclosmatium globosum]|eukprot:ORY36151.1 hypothetical protein BCR33DRAFT_722248 [Rhizoclosmatium globosum]
MLSSPSPSTLNQGPVDTGGIAGIPGTPVSAPVAVSSNGSSTSQAFQGEVKAGGLAPQDMLQKDKHQQHQQQQQYAQDSHSQQQQQQHHQHQHEALTQLITMTSGMHPGRGEQLRTALEQRIATLVPLVQAAEADAAALARSHQAQLAVWSQLAADLSAAESLFAAVAAVLKSSSTLTLSGESATTTTTTTTSTATSTSKNFHFSLPCLAFNAPEPVNACSDALCPFDHTCLYCREKTHKLVDCPNKPCICPFFNSPSENQCKPNRCTRLNVCLYCLDDHPFYKCQLAKQTPAADSCNNWNATGFCTKACSRPHVCIRCAGPHTSFECPHNMDSLLQNPRLDTIFEGFTYGAFVTRKSFSRNAALPLQHESLNALSVSVFEPNAENYANGTSSFVGYNSHPSKSRPTHSSFFYDSKHEHSSRKSRHSDRHSSTSRRRNYSNRDRDSSRDHFRDSQDPEDRDMDRDDRDRYDKDRYDKEYDTRPTYSDREYARDVRGEPEKPTSLGYGKEKSFTTPPTSSMLDTPPPPPPVQNYGAGNKRERSISGDNFHRDDGSNVEEGFGGREKRGRTAASSSSSFLTSFTPMSNIANAQSSTAVGGESSLSTAGPPAISSMSSPAPASYHDSPSATISPRTSASAPSLSTAPDHNSSGYSSHPFASALGGSSSKYNNNFDSPPTTKPYGEKQNGYHQNKRHNNNSRNNDYNGGGSGGTYQKRERNGHHGEQRTGPVIGNDGEQKPCFNFNDKGKCSHGDRCWYKHACTACGSRSHGKSECY